MEIKKPVDLGDILSRPVEVNTGSAMFTLDGDIESEVQLDDELIQEAEVITDPPTATQQPTGPTPTLTPMQAAKTFVNSINGLQSFAIPMLREKRLFTDSELEIIRNMDMSPNTMYSVDSKEDKLLKRWQRHIAVKKQVPFTDDEKERLTVGTAAYIQTENIQISPFMALTMTWSEIILSRTYMFMED